METYKKNHQPVAQCYFCGEDFSPSQLELHVKQCGCVLEPCPDKCGLYVQRKYKNHHASWCKKDTSEQPKCKSVTAELAELRHNLELEVLERKKDGESFTEHIAKSNQKIKHMEELNSKLIDAITGVRNLLNEEQHLRSIAILDVKTGLNDLIKSISPLKFSLNQTKVDVEELRNVMISNESNEQISVQFQEWKKTQDEIVSSLKAAFDQDINSKIHKIYNDHIVRSKSVNDLLDLNEVIIDTQDKYTEQIYQLEVEIKNLKKFFAEENIMISGIWRDQLDEIKVVKIKYEESDNLIKNIIDEQKLIKEKIKHFENSSRDLLNNLNTVCIDKNNDKVVGRSISDDLIQELIDEKNNVRERLKSLEMLHLKERNLSSDTVLSVFDDAAVKQQNEIAQRLKALENLSEVQCNCNKIGSQVNDKNCISDILNEISSEQVIMKRRLEVLEVITHDLDEVKSKLSINSVSKQFNGVQVNDYVDHSSLSEQRAWFEVCRETLVGRFSGTITLHWDIVASRGLATCYSAEPGPPEFLYTSQTMHDALIRMNDLHRVRRLMWTISNFNQKLDEAKTNQTQIESPLFYTSENGYKLQLKAHLNGIGQWEGRHVIISLHVLPVPWENRLAWPCRLKVIFCLRDQEPVHRKAKDIVKSFTSSPAAKGFESACLQMFIPHRTLYTRSYLKNNLIMIEVKTLPLT